MVQPINYMIPQADPFAGVLQGLKLGASVQQMEAAREQQAMQAAAQQQAMALKAAQEQEIQAKLAAQNRLTTAADSLMGKIRNGTATADDFAQYRLVAPKDQSEAAGRVWEGMSKTQQDNALSFGMQVMSALDSKDPQIGITMLEERAAAEREKNPQMAQAWETVAKLAKLDPANGVFIAGDVIGGLPGGGGKQALEAWQKTRDERRARALEPFKLREQTATTLIKEAEANLAPAKLGAALNLTNAQIEQANAARRASDAAAAKSGADAVRARAEANQLSAGVIPAEKRPEAESKFRREYSDQTKGYQEVKSAYGRVLASEDTAVGDLSLIFGYMKMLDPGSVVREGEFATAQNAAGVPERIQNIYNRVVSGQRLSPSQRSSFKGQAGKLYETAQTQEGQVRQGIERIAKGYGLNTANIFYQATETPPKGGEPPAAIPGAPVRPGQVTPAGPRAAPSAASPYAGMSNEELLRRLTQSPMPGGR
jgi:hypothetical protein